MLRVQLRIDTTRLFTRLQVTFKREKMLKRAALFSRAIRFNSVNIKKDVRYEPQKINEKKELQLQQLPELEKKQFWNEHLFFCSFLGKLWAILEPCLT